MTGIMSESRKTPIKVVKEEDCATLQYRGKHRFELTAFIDDHRVGSIVLIRIEKRTIFLGDLEVIEIHRRRGIATALMDEATKYIDQKNYASNLWILLPIEHKKEPEKYWLTRFYIGYGFVPIHITEINISRRTHVKVEFTRNATWQCPTNTKE